MTRSLGLLIIALSGCVVDTSVAERPRNAVEKLSDAYEDWCFDTCARLIAECSSEECSCGDSDSAPPSQAPTSGSSDVSSDGSAPTPSDDCQCSPTSVDQCTAQCREVMSGFRDHGESCARAGLASMRCIDDISTCAELESAGSNCFQEPKDVASCNGGVVTCDIEDGRSYEPNDSGAPVYPYPAAAGGSTGSSGDTGSSCTYEVSDCSDGALYAVYCAGAGDIYCDCYKNGEYENTFLLPGSTCILPSYAVNPGCDWNVRNFD